MKPVNPDCERCGGSGTVNVTIGGDGYGGRCCGEMDCEADCPECEEWADFMAEEQSKQVSP